MVKFYSYSRTRKDATSTPQDAPHDKTPVPPAAPPKPDTPRGKTQSQSDRNRYQSAQKKMKGMKVSIASKLETLQLLPYSFSADQMGSFFYDELEQTNNSDSSDFWKAFYKRVHPISQSLPLVLLNHKEIFRALLEVVRDPATCTFGLKMLFGLLRDIREDAFDLMMEAGLATVAGIMMADEAVFERSMIVLAAFVRNCFKRLVNHLEAFLAKTIDICFNEIQPKQVLRVFAELAAFLKKGCPDDHEKRLIVKHLIKRAIAVNTHSRPQMERNVVYFVACFQFEILKHFQHTLTPNFQQTLASILEVVEESHQAVRPTPLGPHHASPSQTSDYLLRSLRVLNFKLMKAELKFGSQSKPKSGPVFADLAAELRRRSHGILHKFGETALETILFDRVIYRHAYTLTSEYVPLFMGLLQESASIKTALTVHMLPRLTDIQCGQLLDSQNSVSKLFEFLSEIVFLTETDSIIESLFNDGYLLTPDRPVVITNVSSEASRGMITRAMTLVPSQDSDQVEQFGKVGLLIAKIADSSHLNTVITNFAECRPESLAVLFESTTDPATQLGLFTFVFATKCELWPTFVSKATKPIVQAAKSLAEFFAFLKVKNFDYQKLSNKQKINLFDEEQPDNWRTQACLYARLFQVVTGAAQQPNLGAKLTETLTKLQSFFSKNMIADPNFLLQLLLTPNEETTRSVAQNLGAVLPYCINIRNSGLKLALLRAIESSGTVGDGLTAEFGSRRLVATLIEVGL
jgi:hypothetical protein